MQLNNIIPKHLIPSVKPLEFAKPRYAMHTPTLHKEENHPTSKPPQHQPINPLLSLPPGVTSVNTFDGIRSVSVVVGQV